MKRAALFLLLLASGCGGDQDRLTDEQAMRDAVPGQEQLPPGTSPAAGTPAVLPVEPGEIVYKALGTEPGWALTVRENAMLYQGDGGQMRLIETTPPGFAPRAGTYRSGRLAITIARGPCGDGLSNHSWRDRVTISVAGEEAARGCGGGLLAVDAARGDWMITAINGRATSGDGRYYHLALASAGITGAFGCNSFSGRVRQNGDRLSISRMAGTQKGCRDPARSFERDGLAVLASNPRIEQANGRTRLVSEAGTIDLAPRQEEGPTT